MTSNISDFKKYFAQQPYNSKKILYEFNKPVHENCFFRNLDILREESEYISFNKESWRMRPDMFCSDYYKDHNLYPVILLVNNISTIFKFTAEDVKERIIIAPKYNIMIKMLNT